MSGAYGIELMCRPESHIFSKQGASRLSSLSNWNVLALELMTCCASVGQWVIRRVLEYACPVWHSSLTIAQ